MNIKQIEERTGMTRANIRFYEKEGLLEPARQENGYRSYSEEDLRELEKCKLLRSLGVPIGEIRRARAGEEPLWQIIERRQKDIAGEAQSLQDADRICTRMAGDRVSYADLDPRVYLHEAPQAPEEDRLPRVKAPWRRYFARLLDLELCNLLWIGSLTAFTQIPWWNRQVSMQLLGLVVGLLLLFLLEPVCLHYFGATPGKWLLGLRVTDLNGDRLGWWDAFSRTYEVMKRGLGFQLPGWSEWRLWRSYRDLEDGEPLSWEENSVLEQRGNDKLQIALYPLAVALLAGAVVCLALVQQTPDNRGELTVEEFAENFNQARHQLGYDPALSLDQAGKWQQKPGEMIVFLGQPVDRWPDYTYEKVGDTLIGVGLSVTQSGTEDWVFPGDYGRDTAVLAFVAARSGLFDRDLWRLMKQLESHPFESWEMTVGGVRVVSRVEYRDYSTSPDLAILFPDPKGDPHFDLEFSMTLENG